MTRRSCLLVPGSLLLCSLLFDPVLAAAGALESGCKPGTKVPRFPVKAATGPDQGKTVCYVCKSGARPSVIVFTRKLTPDLLAAVKLLDGEVRGSKERSALLVLLDDNTRANAKRLADLAVKEMLQIPLAVNARGKTDPPYDLNPEVLHTFVFYRERAAVRSLAFNAMGLRETKAVAKAAKTTFRQ